MKPTTSNSISRKLRQARPARRGFSLVELLVVLGILTLLMSIAFATLGRTGTAAKIAATRTTIEQIDSVLQERLEAFGRLEFRNQVKFVKNAYDNPGNDVLPPGSPDGFADPLPLVVAEALVRKDRFRAAFPQRVSDLYGLDRIAGGGDDAPLLALVYSNSSLTPPSMPEDEPVDPDPATVSSELLYLALTEGSVFSGPQLSLDNINPDHLKDTDGDGLTEIVDAWDTPVQFYNWPTRLIRPGGPTSTITAAQRVYADSLISGLPPLSAATGTLTFDDYTNPLNIDPDDSLNRIPLFFGNTWSFGGGAAPAFNEGNYHTFGTYQIPLIVSSGPDLNLGLYLPSYTPTSAPFPPVPERAPERLAQVLPGEESSVFDNITNRQRPGGAN